MVPLSTRAKTGVTRKLTSRGSRFIAALHLSHFRPCALLAGREFTHDLEFPAANYYTAFGIDALIYSPMTKLNWEKRIMAICLLSRAEIIINFCFLFPLGR
jgi:hypothetical protein